MQAILTAVFQPLPPPTVAAVLLSTAVAVAVVVVRPVWRWARGVVTLAHEGGHAVVALLTGRQLTGVRVHLDTSGVTLSRGQPRGPGMVLTLLAGYPAPAVLGVVSAVLAAQGRSGLLLGVALLALAAMLVVIRNVVGFLAVTLTGAAFAATLWLGSSEVLAAAGYVLALFLLLGSVRAVVELGRSRRRMRGRGQLGSDADQLAGLTRVPAPVWVGFFWLSCAGALALGLLFLAPALTR